MTTTATRIRQLASEAYRYGEVKTRDDGETYWTTRDNAPEWVRDLVRHAHDELLPDNWRYEAIYAALDAIRLGEVETDDIDGPAEFADSLVDGLAYRERTEWLGSNLIRAVYCDEAQAELGAADDIMSAIALGQYAEALEIYGLVVDYLRSVVEEREDDE